MIPVEDFGRRFGQKISSWAKSFARGRASIDQLAAVFQQVPCSCDGLAREAVRRLARSGSAVSDVSRTLAISRRQLTRRFDAAL